VEDDLLREALLAWLEENSSIRDTPAVAAQEAADAAIDPAAQQASGDAAVDPEAAASGTSAMATEPIATEPEPADPPA
jgi:hypothetical protein